MKELGLRLNTLFVGDREVLSAVVERMTDVKEPVHHWRSGDKLELPHDGTVFLHQVGELSPSDQTRLHCWLESSRARVVSTTSDDLFGRVRAGLFIEVLYYRLNVLRLELAAS
ncbi:MAG: sigma 54-interacting transcriptional regulator [Patescibacteria group bacterium]